jgi:hypothetical protein
MIGNKINGFSLKYAYSIRTFRTLAMIELEVAEN